jgi:hypothetical protein
MTDINSALIHSLNSHGFAFQYAVLKHIEELFENGSPWVFEAAEFPVSAQGKSIHADIILRNKYQHFYLVAECKRSNPAFANWCFTKTPYVGRNISSGRERIVREVIYGNPLNPKGARVRLDWIDRTSDIYRLCFELKTGEKGDANYGKGAFQDALAQVLRGMNGLMNYAASAIKNENPKLFDKAGAGMLTASFLPVIFTTANLWTTDIDISRADLNNGEMRNIEPNLKERKWLFFHYGQSPDLKHDIGRYPTPLDISESLYFDYTRTVAVVNTSGIADFMKSELWQHPGDWHGDLMENQ